MKKNITSNTIVNKLAAVEGVRGLACLTVLFSHLVLIFFPFLHIQNKELIKSSFDDFVFKIPIGFLYSGTSAVYIFFCLSGFILTYACINKGDILYNSSKMFLSRHLRLAIPTFFSIIICAVILFIFKGNADNMPWISQFGKNVNLEILPVIYNSLFSSVILGDASYNWVVWTMQIELFGSFLIFFSAPIIHNLKARAFFYILFSLVFCMNYPTKIGFGYAAFMLGAAIYYIPVLKNKFFAAVILLIGLYLSGYHHKQTFYSALSQLEIEVLNKNGIQGSFLYLMISGALIVMVCIKSNIITFITSNRLSIWLGKLSFSAYLLQMPVFYIITPTMFAYLSTNGFSYTIAAFLTSIFCLFFLYFISIFFQKYIDSKSTFLSKKLIGIFLYKKE